MAKLKGAAKEAFKLRMAKGRAAAAKKKGTKVAKKVAKKVTKHVAKKATKKVVKHVAKKVVAKKVVARKTTKKTTKKVSARAKMLKKMTPKERRHVATMERHGSRLISNPKFAPAHSETSRTKLPMSARLLNAGEEIKGIIHRKVKGHKMPKRYSIDIKRNANPRKKKVHAKKRNPLVISNPIVVSNPKKKHHKRKHAMKRNPILFSKNPMGAVIGMESKVLGMIAPLNNYTEKFLNIGVLEIAGLAIGASFDGMILGQLNKITFLKTNVLAHIPAEYQAPAVMGFGGLLLHGLNMIIAKKGGKKSVIVDEISKGMLAAALVKSFASFSAFSSENEALAGYQYTPAMSGAGMNGYIHSNPHHMNGIVHANPSVSMPVGKSDFQGADFQGADFQGADFAGGDSVGGADFDGYVTTMGDMDGVDFGSDSSSMGSWGDGI